MSSSFWIIMLIIVCFPVFHTGSRSAKGVMQIDPPGNLALNDGSKESDPTSARSDCPRPDLPRFLRATSSILTHILMSRLLSHPLTWKNSRVLSAELFPSRFRLRAFLAKADIEGLLWSYAVSWTRECYSRLKRLYLAGAWFRVVVNWKLNRPWDTCVNAWIDFDDMSILNRRSAGPELCHAVSWDRPNQDLVVSPRVIGSRVDLGSNIDFGPTCRRLFYRAP